jgi:hypothetical protein
MPLLGYVFSLQLAACNCSWVPGTEAFRPLKHITTAHCQLFQLPTHFHSFIRSVTEKTPSVSLILTMAFIRFARISMFFRPWPL